MHVDLGVKFYHLLILKYLNGIMESRMNPLNSTTCSLLKYMVAIHVCVSYFANISFQMRSTKKTWEAKSIFFCLFGATVLSFFALHKNVMYYLTNILGYVMHICVYLQNNSNIFYTPKISLPIFGNCAPCSLEAKTTLSDSSFSR